MLDPKTNVALHIKLLNKRCSKKLDFAQKIVDPWSRDCSPIYNFYKLNKIMFDNRSQLHYSLS